MNALRRKYISPSQGVYITYSVLISRDPFINSFDPIVALLEHILSPFGVRNLYFKA
jgi:hypothetical protein